MMYSARFLAVTIFHLLHTQPIMEHRLQTQPGSRLVGWKRIAAHLGCSERTARRWEKEEDLPVHRQQHASQSTVFAHAPELDRWITLRADAPLQPSARWDSASYRNVLVVGALIFIGFLGILGLSAVYQDRSVDPIGSEDPIAVDLYQQGRALWRERGKVPNTRAVKLLEEAVKRDETYAEAWQALGSAWMTLPTYSDEVDPGQAFAEALFAADRAISLDASLVEARSVMAGVAQLRGDWIESKRIFDDAISKAPDNTMLMLWRAEHYRDLGYIMENKAQLEAALERDPNSPPIQIALAMNRHITDDLETGQETLRHLWHDKGIETPTGWFGTWHIHVRQNQFDAAETWLAESPLPIDIDLLKLFLDTMRDGSHAAKKQMASKISTAYTEGLPGWFAYVLLSHLGAIDIAMEIASRETDTGRFELSIVMFDPNFPAARQTERFEDVVRRLGYTDYWQQYGPPDFCSEVPAPRICHEL